MKKKISPTSPAKRHLVVINNYFLNKFSLLKKEIKGLKNSSGKNHLGKITSYHKGGGHKKRYRLINFKRNTNSIGIIMSLEYDPNRTSFIASVYDFLNCISYYILAPINLKIGDIIKTGLNAELKIGHSLSLSNIPIGCFIHSISDKINKKATISRSAGTYSKLIEKTSTNSKIKVSSGKLITISLKSFATIGIIGNNLNSLTTIGKAGRARWLNNRPKVRGVAMNPVDHPHGGGEGKTSGLSVTPWGKPTKGGKTALKKLKVY